MAEQWGSYFIPCSLMRAREHRSKYFPREHGEPEATGEKGSRCPGGQPSRWRKRSPEAEGPRVCGLGRLAGNVPAQWGFSLMLPAVIYFPFKSEMSL